MTYLIIKFASHTLKTLFFTNSKQRERTNKTKVSKFEVIYIMAERKATRTSIRPFDKIIIPNSRLKNVQFV